MNWELTIQIFGVLLAIGSIVWYVWTEKQK